MKGKSKQGKSKPKNGNQKGKQNSNSSLTKEPKGFKIEIRLKPTQEVFTLEHIHNDMKISELKDLAEFVTGVPRNIQRLTYLDEGELLEHSDVRSNDIVPGALLYMDVWGMWKALIEASALNDEDMLFQLGVTEDSKFNTPNSEFMNPTARKEWLEERANVALYIAAHRGNTKMMEKLIATGADLNATTPTGRSPLHVAAARGHGSIVDLLLEKGADIDAEDSDGNNALAVAEKFGNKGCGRHLFLFQWQQRAKGTKPQISHPMFAHQYFDSSLPVWLKGEQAQVYFAHILPPGEFEGTSFGAPRRKPPGSKVEPESDSETEYVPSLPGSDSRHNSGDAGRGGLSAIREEERRRTDKTKSFADWLAKKEAEDAIRLAREREEKRKKKLEEDEKKRAKELKAELEDKSYDQWLAEREAQTKKGALGPGSKSAAASGGKTTEDIIASVLERRREEGLQRGVPSDLWKIVRDPTKYKEIQYRGLMLLENYNDQGQPS